ncbi:hypothetical protein HDV57DRAFT_350464 [Trichoderma longibrachiatum]|uniref:Apple domain-containing protein n=1 Tax=Trichoderma longibrachiatum ATCC 18648 TaxID=983965 RepID=A0A2T4BR62_TRILO|nr:hypothetical protein M440DRAFT_1385732 [Trichoderma longibrachiatum ATCC 18648]
MGSHPQYSPDGRGGDVDRGRSRTISTGRSDSDYYIHGRGRQDSFRAAPDGGSTAPDRRSVVPSSGTFYREPTPERPPQTRDTNLDASSTTNILQKAGEFYDYQYDHVAPPAPIPAATICGVKARLFWLLLGAVALLVVIAVAVGIGVGVGGLHKSSAETSPGTMPSQTSHTKASAPTPTSRSKTAGAPEPTSTHLLSCPQGNGTRYDVPNSHKTFQLVCDIDYSGAGEATDVASLYTTDMEACITNCASFIGCTGCGWGVIPGDAGSLHRCWLKGSLGKTHQSKPGWYFAILQGS